MMHPETIRTLQSFRADLYGCFDRREDALFELVHALLTSGPLLSLPHLSLEAPHRRSWGSVYAALAYGSIAVDLLRAVGGRHPLADGQPIYAVDLSVWPRCDAEASPGRGYYYHPARHSAGKPIVAGWAYQWPAQLGFARDSWTAPLDVRRVHPTEDADAVAVEQIVALLRLLAPGPVPLFVFDAGYDSAHLTQRLAGVPAAILVRLRADRCFYADPPPAAPSAKGGRPRRHGAKFAWTRRRGPSRPPSARSKTSSTAPSGFGPGPACTRSSRRTRRAGLARRARSSAARWCSSK